jgi:alpha-N-dichloroacetyl-p-aminophenylserinol N-oxygenase
VRDLEPPPLTDAASGSAHGAVAEPCAASRAVLQKMARSWNARAQVRKASATEELAFDLDRPDFAVELLPFRDHPRFLALDAPVRARVLSAAWLAYNSKTLDIESWIVSPFCHDVLGGSVRGLDDEISHQIVSETLVDESFHVLLTVNATNLTRRMRDLPLRLPPSELLRRARQEQAAHVAPWQRALLGLAVAVVSEVFISDYLLLLSGSETLQPLHRLAVDSHRRDEASHGVVFRHLAKIAYRAMSPREQEFFAAALPRPVRWFAAPDAATWSALLNQLGVAGADELVGDCLRHGADELSTIDYTGVVELAHELGITSGAIGRDAFHREGLVA